MQALFCPAAAAVIVYRCLPNGFKITRGPSIDNCIELITKIRTHGPHAHHHRATLDAKPHRKSDHSGLICTVCKLCLMYYPHTQSQSKETMFYSLKEQVFFLWECMILYLDNYQTPYNFYLRHTKKKAAHIVHAKVDFPIAVCHSPVPPLPTGQKMVTRAFVRDECHPCVSCIRYLSLPLVHLLSSR